MKRVLKITSLILLLVFLNVMVGQTPSYAAVSQTTPNVKKPPPPQIQQVNSILVVSPKANESFSGGDEVTIQWAYTGEIGQTVKVEIIGPTGIGWTIHNLPKGANGVGFYKWKVPQAIILSPNYTVRVSSVANPQVFGKSKPFGIFGQGSLSILQPGPGTDWRKTTLDKAYKHPIVKWKATGAVGEKLRLELWQNGVKLSDMAMPDQAAGIPVSGSYGPNEYYMNSTVIFGYPTGAYTFKLVSMSNPTISASFNVLMGSSDTEITFLSPAEGTLFYAGNIATVSWMAPGITNTNMTLALFDAFNDNPLILITDKILAQAMGPSQTLSYNYQIPNTLPAGDYRFKMKKASSDKWYSSKLFRIMPVQMEVGLKHPHWDTPLKPSLFQGQLFRVGWKSSGSMPGQSMELSLIDSQQQPVAQLASAIPFASSGISPQLKLPEATPPGTYQLKFSSGANLIHITGNIHIEVLSQESLAPYFIKPSQGMQIKLGNELDIELYSPNTVGDQLTLSLLKDEVHIMNLASNLSFNEKQKSFKYKLSPLLVIGPNYSVKATFSSGIALKSAPFSIVAP